MIWIRHVAFVEKKNIFEISFGRSQKKKPLVRPRCKWEVVFIVVICCNFL
jgi:hypothetical protein